MSYKEIDPILELFEEVSGVTLIREFKDYETRGFIIGTTPVMIFKPKDGQVGINVWSIPEDEVCCVKVEELGSKLIELWKKLR